MTADKLPQADETRHVGAERLTEKIVEVREHAEQLAKRGKTRAIELEHEFEDYVKQHPVQSVTVAAGVGALAGFAAGLIVGRR